MSFEFSHFKCDWIFEYILHQKFLVKSFIVLSPCVQIPPTAPACNAVSVKKKKNTAENLKRAFFYPDILIACTHHHWLLTLMIEERNYFLEWRSILDCFYLLSFSSHLILFCIILWQENETKGKGSLHTFYFKLQFIWASNMSVLFNSLGWYLSGFLKYNTINPCLQTPWNIYWIIQYRF